VLAEHVLEIGVETERVVYLIPAPNVDLLISRVEIAIGQKKACGPVFIREEIAVVSTPYECPR
jgi:hypothetical protein